MIKETKRTTQVEFTDSEVFCDICGNKLTYKGIFEINNNSIDFEDFLYDFGIDVCDECYPTDEFEQDIEIIRSQMFELLTIEGDRIKEKLLNERSKRKAV